MSKRPNPKSETTPPALAGKPRKPGNLGRHGTAFWDETINVVAEMRVLTKADRRALELTARAYEEYRQCEAVLREKGRSYESKTDRGSSVIVRPRPEATQADAAWKRVMKGLIEFGLTPASRARVASFTPAVQDDFEEFLNHGRSLNKPR